MWGPSEEEVGEGCRREVSGQVLAGSQLSAEDYLRFILDLPIMSWYPQNSMVHIQLQFE